MRRCGQNTLRPPRLPGRSRTKREREALLKAFVVVGGDEISSSVVEGVLKDRLHQAILLANESAALEACEKELPSFIFTPWRDPEDTARFLKAVRGRPSGDQVMLMAIVAAERPEEWSAALLAGANDYIPRPVDERLVEWRLAIAERQSGELRRRMKAESSLLRLEKAVDTMQIGVTISDPNGKIVFINPAEAEMHGYRVEELLGRSVRVFADGPGPERTAATLQRIGRWSRERWSRKKDGALIPVRLLSDLLSDPEGRPVGVVTTCEDITERRQAEEALGESETRYRSLVEAASDVIGTAAPDGTLTSLNPAFDRLTGYPREAWIGKSIVPLIHPGNLRAVRDNVKRALEGTPSPLAEARCVTAGGRYVEVEYTVAPRREADGVRGVLAIVRDISERRRIERLNTMQSAVTRLLSEAPSVEEAVPAFLALVCRTIGWQVGEFWQISSGGSTLQFLHVDRSAEAEVRPYAEGIRSFALRPGHGVPARVLSSNEPVWLTDVTKDPELPRRSAIARAAGIHAMIAFPVGAGADTSGVIVLAAREVLEPDPELLRVLPDSGRQLGHFIRRTAAEAALRASEERFTLAVLGANDGIWDWTFTTGETFYSPRWKMMLGYSEHEIGSTPEDWFSRVHADDRDRLISQISAHLQGATPFLVAEYRIRHRDGSYRWVLTRGAAVRDRRGTLCRMAGSQTDVTDRRGYDPLTLLPNRSLFLERLELAIARAQQSPDYGYAVLFVDLDKFKETNDTFGHVTGDQVLVAVARRLEESVRPGDTVARLGGDEFIVLLDRILGAQDAEIVATRIEDRLGAPLPDVGAAITASASIGIALGSARIKRPDEILRNADTAMYRAKTAGRARHEMFEELERPEATVKR